MLFALLLLGTALCMAQAGCGRREEPKPPEAGPPESQPAPPACADRPGTLASDALAKARSEPGFDAEKYARAQSLAARLRGYDYRRTGNVPQTSAQMEQKEGASPFLTPNTLQPDENLVFILGGIEEIGRPAVPALLQEFVGTAGAESCALLLLPLRRMPEASDLFMPFVLEALENDARGTVRQAAAGTIAGALAASERPDALAAEAAPGLLAAALRTLKGDVAQAAFSLVYEFQTRGYRLDAEQIEAVKAAIREMDFSGARGLLAARCLLEQGEGTEFLLNALRESRELMVTGDPGKKETALWALHLFGEKRVAAAAPDAVRLLSDRTNADLRKTAAWTLGRLAGGDGKEEILSALGNALAREKDPPVFREIARELARSGDEKALRQIFRQSRENEDPSLRLHSLSVLADCLEAGDVPAALAAEIMADFRLRAQKERDLSLRLRCVRALGAASRTGGEDSQDAIAAELVGIMNNDGCFWIRGEAAAALGRFTGPVTDLLEALHGDDAEYVKLRVIRSLGERGAPEAVVPIVEMMKDGSGGVVMACAEALPKLEGFLPALLFSRYLSAGVSECARNNILMCLRHMKYDDAILLFLMDEALSAEKDAARRADIARDIGRRLSPGHPFTRQAAARLVNSLNAETDTQVMSALIDVLGGIGVGDAQDGIIQAARRNERVVPEAIRALRNIGNPAALDFFLEILSKVTLENYQIYRIQAEAVAAAVRSFDRQVVAAKIRKAGGDAGADPEIRRAALTLTCVLDDPTIGGYLIETAENREEPIAVRTGAILGLGLRRHAGAVPRLAAMLKSDEEEIAVSAAYALGAIGDMRAFRPLYDTLRAYRDGPPEKKRLKNMAVASLQALTGADCGEDVYAWDNWYKEYRSREEGKGGD